jgi:hypothetical protein
VLWVLNIRTISIDILCICHSPITVRALVRVGIGRAGRLMALEKARSRVSGILLTLHQLTETRNARGHAKGAEPKISLRRSFNVLGSAKSSAAATRLVKWIGLASASTRFDSISPWGLRALFTIFFGESLKVAQRLFLCRAWNILHTLLGEQILESAFSTKTSKSSFLLSGGGLRSVRAQREGTKGTHRGEVGIV